MKSRVKGVRLKGYLLEWAESLDNGDFSYHVKEALRQYLSGESVKHKLNSNVEYNSLNENDAKFTFREIKNQASVDDLENKLDNF